MIRANIKISDDAYIGFIDEDNDFFRIIWNKNRDNYEALSLLTSNEVFQTFEDACQRVYRMLGDAKISETIYFKSQHK